MVLNKRDVAVELLGHSGRFMPDSPNLKYFLRVGSRSFRAAETDELVDKVVAGNSLEQLEDALDNTTFRRSR